MTLLFISDIVARHSPPDEFHKENIIHFGCFRWPGMKFGKGDAVMEKPLKKQYPGVATVSGTEHKDMVAEIFSTIPERYDFLNHLMSFSMDKGWRKFAVARMKFPQTGRFLDIATGTGDLAIAAARAFPKIQVTALDFAGEMMAVGRQKVDRTLLSDRIAFLQGDAMQIPLPGNTVDVVAVAFGIRNMPDRKRALEEMCRVTVPGGQVMVLEMNFPRQFWWAGCYRFYLKHIMPWIAAVFTKNPAAYRYLADSIMNFPQPDAFDRLMREAGLENIAQYPLTLGTTYLHLGEKSRP